MFWKGIGIFTSFEHQKHMSLVRCFSFEAVDEMGLGTKTEFDDFCVLVQSILCRLLIFCVYSDGECRL